MSVPQIILFVNRIYLVFENQLFETGRIVMYRKLTLARKVPHSALSYLRVYKNRKNEDKHISKVTREQGKKQSTGVEGRLKCSCALLLASLRKISSILHQEATKETKRVF